MKNNVAGSGCINHDCDECVSRPDAQRAALDRMTENAEELRLYDAPQPEFAAPTVVEPEPVAHMYPSDLERFRTAETFATAYSVAVGCPDERSLPLYTHPPRTALTDDDITLIAIASGIDELAMTEREWSGMRRFARAIERTHGITASEGPRNE